MHVLFDGNYLFHKTFSVFSTYYKGQDMAEVLADKEKRQVLLRKCIIDMCHTLKRFEKDLTRVAFVIDSHSWRYNFYDDYKYALTRTYDASHQGFIDCLDEFEALLRKRGIIVSRVQGAEGDDLIYVWSLYFGYCLDEQLVIITGDSDIRQIMNNNVALFNNHSKNLKLYCTPDKEVYWNEYMDADVQVVPTVPFEVLLYKVIMGDTSDNIPKIKTGMGPRGFEKFIEWMKPYTEPKNMDLITMARWIADKFAEYTHQNEDEVLGKILFNLQMTWLNLSVYNEMNYYSRSGESLLERMLNDVNLQKDKYSYNKTYTLENFYGLPIK